MTANWSLGLITAAILLLSAAAPANADQFTCSMSLPTTVAVELTNPPMQFSTDLSLNDMRQAAEAIGHVGPIVGAYRLTIRYRADVDGTAQDIAGEITA